jgi:hypothetical protein
MGESTPPAAAGGLLSKLCCINREDDLVEIEVAIRGIALKWAGILAASLLVLSANSRAADKEKIVWKPIPDAILQVDSRAPKLWNVFQAGKKFDPLLLQLGSRYLVIYVRNMQVYEIKPELLEHKGEDLVWRETDKPAKPMATSDWSTKDVGSASRTLFKLADEGRVINIEIPQIPDLRRGIY